ncbi:MAG: hypothetical protein P8Y71_03135 [Pseudolabrys sp.]|jgi:hypothetical protein
MVQMVNGYMCFSSCQVAAARVGKDPHAPPGQHDDKDKADGLANSQKPSIFDPGHDKDKKVVNGIDDPSAIDPIARRCDYQDSQGIDLRV